MRNHYFNKLLIYLSICRNVCNVACVRECELPIVNVLVRHEVPEPNSGVGHETEVDALEVSPLCVCV